MGDWEPQNQTDQSDRTDPSDSRSSLSVPYAPWLDHADSTVVANALICLIHQANYLLDQQIAGLERTFVEAGGCSEQLAAARREFRDATPACPLCGKPMRHRTAHQGQHAGQSFWGCTAYPFVPPKPGARSPLPRQLQKSIPRLSRFSPSATLST